MSKHLRTNPLGVFFREAVVTGHAHTSELYLLNTGNANLTISAIGLTSGTRFTWFFPTDSPTQTLPIVLAPLTNFLILLTYDPLTGEENTLNTDTLVITHDGDNTPTNVTVSGWNRPLGTGRLTISPSSWSFDWVDGRDLSLGTPFGQRTNMVHLSVGNSGDGVLTITGINIKAPVLLVPPLPTFPIVLAQGSGYTFTFALTASFVGSAQYNTSIEFFSDAPTSPDDFVVQVTGLAVTSAFTMTGVGPKAMFGFTTVIRQVDPTAIDTEETNSFTRVHDFGTSGIHKTLTRIRFKYEDLGIATVNVLAKVSTTDPVTGLAVTKTVNKDVVIGTIGADQYVKDAFADLQVEGELIEIKFSRISGNGPLSILSYVPVYDELSELTFFGNLPAVVSAFNTTTTPLPLFAFGSTIRQMAGSLDTEEAGSFSFQRNLQDPGNEKTVSKVLLKYEDKGVMALTVTDKTKRQTVTASLALGTGAADGLVRPAEFDFINSDELHLITVSRAAASGPVSIVELLPTVAPRGVTVKE